MRRNYELSSSRYGLNLIVLAHISDNYNLAELALSMCYVVNIAAQVDVP